MDPTRYRREIQTERQQRLNSFENIATVSKSVSQRPRDLDLVTRRPRRERVSTPPQMSVPPPKRRLPPIDMDLPGEPSQQRFRLVMHHPRLRALRHRAFQISAFAMVLIIAVGGLLFTQGYWKAQKVFKGGAQTAAALENTVDPNMLKGEGDGRINVLMMGRGGGYHHAPDLTDTMILASIDPVNNTATMLSIPRDLWIKTAKYGQMKINAAWQAGEFAYLGEIAPGSTDTQAIKQGFESVDQAVETVLGVPVHYNLLVNFDGFKKAIDTVNGVTVNVPAALIDPSIAWENGGSSVIAQAGSQQFNGKQALLYVRSRQTSNDFARSERQRAVMMGLKDKVDNLGTLSNPIKISSLLNTFGNNVQTDLSLNNASRLYGIVKKIEASKVSSVGLADPPNQYVATAPIRGRSAVVPKAGLFNYGDIQTFVRGQLKDGYIVKENAKVVVLNGSGQAGKAEATATMLKSYGYNVVKTGELTNKNYRATTLVDLSKNRAKYTKNYLQKRFNVKSVPKFSEPVILPNGTDFVIIVGSNESSNPQD